MEENTDIVIIGGGHAGLSVSYFLTMRGIRHIILEQGSLGESWRSKRWDSFTLVSPCSLLRLPGFPYQGDPNRFLSRDEFICHLERYAASFNAPLQCHKKVISLEQAPGTGFILKLTDKILKAKKVVVATGCTHIAKRSSFSTQLPPGILQMNSCEYRNPKQLPPGAVLVVGSGQSGTQLAEELLEAGRQVFLAVGRCGRWPRRYRGKDVQEWLMEMDDRTIDMMPEPKPRMDVNPYVSGRHGGHEIDLRHLGRQGLMLAGRLIGFEKDKFLFADDLQENLARAEEKVIDTKKQIDDYILRYNLAAPEEITAENNAVIEESAPAPIPIRQLDAKDISIIIWAMGYAIDFSWIKLPVHDAGGFPVHTRGLSKIKGLYFIGLPWQYKAASSGLAGVAEDAAYLSNHLQCAE